MYLTMDAFAQVIHDCETGTSVKQAKRMKSLWGRGDGKVVDYTILPQTHNSKHCVLTMVETTTAWLET